jgi:hypothetical protein
LAASVLYKKVPKVNNHPMGENSSNLVTLPPSMLFFSNRQENFFLDKHGRNETTFFSTKATAFCPLGIRSRES